MDAIQILMLSAKYPTKKLYNKCIEVATHLKGKLPYSHRHPNGRNSTAHVFQMIKSKFGVSYKYVQNKEALLQDLDWLYDNPR